MAGFLLRWRTARRPRPAQVMRSRSDLRKQVLAREVEVLETLERDPDLQAKAKLDRAEVALFEHDVRRVQSETRRPASDRSRSQRRGSRR